VLSESEHSLDVELFKVCLISLNFNERQLLPQLGQLLVIRLLVDRLVEQEGFLNSIRSRMLRACLRVSASHVSASIPGQSRSGARA
jgi:hypothetical protein